MTDGGDEHDATTLAHSINNPLTVVLANVAFALEELEDAPRLRGHTLARVREALREAELAALRIREVVARINAGPPPGDGERGPGG